MIEILSIHNLKTGGTSIFESLKSIFGEKQSVNMKRPINIYQENNKIQSINYVNKNKKLKLDEYDIHSRIKLLHGHFYYSEVEPLDKLYNPYKIYFVRNPIDRLISRYNYLIRNINFNPKNHPQKQRINETFEEFIENPATQNQMFKFIEGLPLEKIDFIGIYENFNNDYNKLIKNVCNIKNLKIDKVPILHTNKNIFYKIKDDSIFKKIQNKEYIYTPKSENGELILKKILSNNSLNIKELEYLYKNEKGDWSKYIEKINLSANKNLLNQKEIDDRIRDKIRYLNKDDVLLYEKIWDHRKSDLKEIIKNGITKEKAKF